MGVLFGAGAAAGLGGGLGSAFSAIGSIVGVIGSVMQAQQQAALAKAQAEIAKRNAEIAEQNRRMVAEHGREQAYFQDRKNKAIIGQQVAAMSASGVKIGSPSFLRARESLSKVAGEEAFSIVRSSDKEAWNYGAQASVYRAQAEVYKAQASMYSMQGAFNAIGGLLSVGSSLIGGAQPYTGPSFGLRPRSFRAPTYNFS